MTDQAEFEEYTGFTVEEVRALCSRFDMDFAETGSWYDGYSFTQFHHVYNPKSVVEAMRRRRYSNYWTSTETYEALKIYMDMDFDGLQPDMIRLLGGGRIRVNTRSFQNDMRSLKVKDDVLTLLIHLGYLGYDSDTQEAFIPNREIMEEFENAMSVGGWAQLLDLDYYDLPENVRAELIDGQIYYMGAPSRVHQKILNFMNTEINIYLRSRNGPCEVYPAPFAVKLFHDDSTTVVEPDISVICDVHKLTDQSCTGAPDWIIEIVSPGNPGHDYVRKLNLYMNAGVREYWIVDPMEREIFVYFLEQNKFKVKSYSFQDKIKVNIYDDLWIALAKLQL